MKIHRPSARVKAPSYSESKAVCAAQGILAILLLLAALVGPGRAALAQEDGGYRLAPGDRVSIRVLSWNAVTLNFETYDALAGTFGVDSGGQLVLPLLKPVAAAGETPAALSEELSQLYQGRLGLSEPPSVTLEIADFGPIFVLGDAARPGRYDFESGMTAIHALALAGGIYRITDTRSDGAASAIRAAGSLEEISGDLARTRMSAARLQAEMDDATSFSVPELPPHPDGPDAQQALYDHELSLFESRRDRQERALASIEESRVLLETEITALEEKLGGVERQLELIRESVGNMESLRERGLARSPALINLQRTQIDLEARELDTQTAIFRARQQLSELDRDVNDIRAGRRLQVLQELQTAQSQIDRLETRRAMTGQLLTGAEGLMLRDELEDDIRTEFEFAILRQDGTGQVRLPAGVSTPLQPRDVLVVTIVPVSE